MRKIIIGVELNQGLEQALYNIRWKHIDIETIIQEEIREYVEEIIKAYGKVI